MSEDELKVGGGGGEEDEEKGQGERTKKEQDQGGPTSRSQLRMSNRKATKETFIIDRKRN